MSLFNQPRGQRRGGTQQPPAPPRRQQGVGGAPIRRSIYDLERGLFGRRTQGRPGGGSTRRQLGSLFRTPPPRAQRFVDPTPSQHFGRRQQAPGQYAPRYQQQQRALFEPLPPYSSVREGGGLFGRSGAAPISEPYPGLSARGDGGIFGGGGSRNSGGMFSRGGSSGAGLFGKTFGTALLGYPSGGLRMFQPSRAAGGGRGAGGSGSLRRRRREALQRRRSETGTSYKHGAARGGNSAYKKGLWALEDLEHGDGRFGHEFGGDGVALHRKRNAIGARWSCVAATARKSAYKNSLWDDEDLEDEQSDEEEGETLHRVRRQSKGYGAHRKHQEAGAVEIDYMRSLREIEDFEDEQFDDEGFDDEYLLVTAGQASS